MVSLTAEDKTFIRRKLKPLLDKTSGDWAEVSRLCVNEHMNILCFMAEQDIDIFDGLQAIPDNFFKGMSISHIHIPSHITTIGEKAFANSTLVTIEIDNGLKLIEESAFESTPLASIVLPDSVETIGKKAFYGCTDLTDVVLSDSVTILPRDTFGGCDRVTIQLNSRKGLSGARQLQIPTGEVEWYKKHTKVKGSKE